MIYAGILLYCISTATAFYIGQLTINELLHGDLTDLKSFFLLQDNKTIYNNSDIDEPDKIEKRRPIGELMEQLERANKILPDKGHEVDDFNKISQEITNMTRKRFYGKATYPYDLDDYYLTGEITERKKKMMLIMANLQFLLHSRHRLQGAFQMSSEVRLDKRYRLGYLFYRLRRLLIEQRKLVAAAEAQNAEKLTRSLYALMRIYEKVVRYDVDIRDTSALIKRVYGEPAGMDFV